jgi:hypothetical protein
MKVDNPKLTAYALGELSPAEQAELEQELRDDREIVAEVEETREIARILRAGLSAEPYGELAEHQRDAIFREARLLELEHKAAGFSATESPASGGETFTPMIVPRAAWWNRPGPWQGIAACAVAGLAAYALFVNVGGHRRTIGSGDPGEMIVQVPIEAGSHAASVTGPNLITPQERPANGGVPSVGVDPGKVASSPSNKPRVVGPSGSDVANMRAAADIGKKQPAPTEENVSAYLKDRMREAEAFREGSTYEDFVRVFQPMPGNPGRFEMIRHPMIKVDAEFGAGASQTGGTSPAPDARLKQISKPYLE